MGKIFSLDNPFFRFMEHVADFFVLNLLTILCSIPVFTIGAAMVALHKAMQNLVMEQELPVIKTYFRAFAENFKQATVAWLLTFLAIALIAADIFLIYVYLSNLAWLLYVLLAVVGVVLLGSACYVFALIARYENTLKEHLRNSFVLAVGKLPRTLLMLLLWCIPLILGLISISVFLDTLVFWAFFGISLIFFAQACIMKPIFLMLEPSSEEEQEDGL